MTPKKSSFVAVLAELAVNMKKLPPLLFLSLGLIVSANALDNDSKNQLPPCEGDYWTNCFGEYSTNEGTSTGEWLNDMWNGKGTTVWLDGSSYIGEFLDGDFHGLGTYDWGKIVHSGDGGITEGEFVYGEPPGCNPYREAIKIYGSFGQGINPEYFIDEILAEAWAKCLDEGL